MSMDFDVSSFCELLREHMVRPRHFGPLAAPTGCAGTGHPSGDELRLWVRVEDGRLAAMRWRSLGSRVLAGVASYVCALVSGMEIEDAAALRVEALEAALELPAEYRYCAFLAVLTLLDAVSDDRWKLRGTRP